MNLSIMHLPTLFFFLKLYTMKKFKKYAIIFCISFDNYASLVSRLLNYDKNFGHLIFVTGLNRTYIKVSA